MSSATSSRSSRATADEEPSAGDTRAAPFSLLPDFVDSSVVSPPAPSDDERHLSLPFRETSLLQLSGSADNLSPNNRKPTVTTKKRPSKAPSTTGRKVFAASSEKTQPPSLDTVQQLLTECTRALEALTRNSNKVVASGSGRRSVVTFPSSRTSSLSDPPSAAERSQSLRRARASVSMDLMGSAVVGIPPVGDERAAVLAPGAEPSPRDVPSDPGSTERRIKVQFEAGVGGDTNDRARVPKTSSRAGASPLEWSVMGSNPLAVTPSLNPSSTPSSRENRRDLDGSRRDLLASSTSAAALDVAYILASLAICIATVTYLALYRTSPGNDDAQVSTPICITAIVVGQAVSMAWCGSRFVVQTRKGEWEIVDRVADIAQLYRRTWLAFDLFCVVPFEWVCLGWATDYAFWLSLRQLVRFGRFLSLIRSGNPLRDTRNTVRMLAFVAFVTFTIHCLAVIFQQIQNESNGPSEQLNYVGALYWAAMTLTSVGYGDVLPVADDWHRIYACVVMFSGVAMIASVTAFATSVLTTTDALQDAIKERKLMLASMIEYYRIPWEVEVEITALLPTALNAENEHKFTQLVSHMPAFMVERIEGYTRAKALSTSIPLFVELPVSVVLELTAHLHQRFYQANECIIQIGDEGREMFFIVTGTAEVVMPLGSDEEVIVAVLRGGSFFGEVALVQDVQRTASVIAVTLCELLVLSKVNFTNLVTRHVELRDIFLKEVFARHNITNLVKHELSIARREQVDDFTAVGDLHETADPRPDANPLALE